MLNIIRKLFLVFLMVVLISICKSHGLAAEEEIGAKDIFDPGQLELIAETNTEKNAKIKSRPSEENTSPRKISLDIKGMDILDVLKLLAKEGNLNVVTGKNVTGRVSMFLKDVNVWDAFEIIIASNGLAYEKKNGIINVMSSRDYELIHGEQYDDRRILSTKKLKFASVKDISAALNQIKSAIGKVVIDESSNTAILLDVPERILAMERVIDETDISYELETKVFELNYAQTEKLKEQLQEVLTKNVGILKTDERTNKIIVVDYPDKIDQIERMIEAFDEKTRQVLIEAKIIQVTLSDEYKMGIDWKVILNKQLNITAFNINRTLNTSGSQIIGGGAQVPTSTEDFRIIMDMLKTFGDAETLSTPRITATNGQEAKILVGSKKVYVTDTVTQTNSGTNTAEQVQFIDVGVKLYVTPTINKDGFISMKIRPEVSSAATSYTTAQGNEIPIVDTSEAETSVIVKDGITIVMGGLMKDEDIKNTYKIPLLGEIPFLGAFFRRTENKTTKTELVIFLTPHIVSGAKNLFEAEN
ncbi:MAG: secretin N-terminal domain-containing protein [Candidatus Omnitrophota bacterium]